MTRFLDRFLPLYSPPGEEGGAAGGGAPSTAAPSGGAESPSPAPASPSAGGEGESTGTTNDSFEGMGLDHDDLESIPGDLPGQTTGEQPPATPTAQPQPSGEPKPAQQAQPEPQPKAPPQAPPQAGQQEPSSPAAPQTPMSLAQEIETHQSALIDELANTQFAFTKEDKEALELDMASALPKMGAKVYYSAVKAALNHIHNFVPQLVHSVLEMQRARDETNKKFYGQFPGLDEAKHHNDVTGYAIAFRNANPNITQEQLWAMVSSAVMAQHGLQAPSIAPNGNGSGIPPVPPRPKNQPEPFVPAQPGAVVRSTPEPENPWGGMGRDFEDDEG